jgi:hypothetical protein
VHWKSGSVNVKLDLFGQEFLLLWSDIRGAAHSQQVRLSDRFASHALLLALGFKLVHFLIVKDFSDVIGGSQPELCLSHVVLETGGQVDFSLINKKAV